MPNNMILETGTQKDKSRFINKSLLQSEPDSLPSSLNKRLENDSLLFINKTIKLVDTDKQLNSFYFIRAFIKFIQQSGNRPNYENLMSFSKVRINLLLFKHYLTRYLKSLNIIGFNIPGQATHFKLMLIISFKGPFLSPCKKSKIINLNRYHYHAKIELSFFNMCNRDLDGNILKQTLLSYFVQNRELLNLSLLQLPDAWILNQVDITTTCRDI